MKVLTWDSAEFTWDSPNAYWGEPGYVLEPGDPGYVPVGPPPLKSKTKRTMSNNPIPRAERSVLALAGDCVKGCTAHQDEVGLKQTRASDLNTLLVALKGDPTATPVVLGLIFIHKQKQLDQAAALTARKETDEEAKAYLIDSRAALIPILGREPSGEWEQAGFADPPASSNAVPGTQDGRLACLSALALYLTQHPTYEVAAGGPRPEVTAARAHALHTQLLAARQAANDADSAQEQAKAAKDDALAALRRRLMALVDELSLLLADDDPRWETFGLNIPASPNPPEPAENLVLSNAGPGKVLAEWDRGTRSDDDRILIQVLTVDNALREYGKSGGDSQEVLKALPPGKTVRVKIIALNGALEAPDGPEAELLIT
jgi:hypothetical protein